MFGLFTDTGSLIELAYRMMSIMSAVTVSPMLLVRDCTTSMATDRMAWVMPEGMPIRMIRQALS